MTRRLIAALAGLLTLAAGLVGLPAFLLAAAHQLAGLLPSAADLPAAVLAPGDGGLFLAFLLAVGWLCWAVFVLAFGVELAARARGVRTPHLGRFVPQHTTAWAITAILAAGAVLTPAAIGPAHAATTATAPPAEAPVAQSSAHTATHPAARELQWEDYRVKRGDTLWDIADERLDDAAQWPEIAAASRDIDQPHGRHLTDPDLILPGWTLRIPTDHSPTSPPSHPSADQTAAPNEGAAPVRLPPTPLRPPADASPHANEASTTRSPIGLPATPLRPAATTTDQQPAASLIAARAGTPQPVGAAAGEGPELVADGLGLPDWLAHPLRAARWQDAPPATRSLALAAMATRRGHTWHQHPWTTPVAGAKPVQPVEGR